MRNARSKALQRIEELIVLLQKTRETSLPSGQGKIPEVEIWRFMMTALQATRAICSENSPHYRELSEEIETYKKSKSIHTDKWLGILQAVSDDLRSGMLSNMRELVAAEVFTDLSEMAEYLVGQGYQIPAVSVSGAVLEDALRKICEKSSIAWSGESSISKLNVLLYKANLYDKVEHGQVEAWGKLRNKVDHGDFAQAEDIDVDNARRMVEGVRDFVARHVI
ncbi:MAG: hypothetical protein R3E79_39700 [Caldilineaceae bacterium]